MFAKRRVQKNLRAKGDEVSASTPLDEQPTKTKPEEESHDSVGEKNCNENSSRAKESEPVVVKGSALKRRKICTLVTKTAKMSSVDAVETYKTERKLNLNTNQRATSEFNVDTDSTHDTRAILERNEEIGKKILAGELEEGIYRGKGAYAPIHNRREGAVAASKYTGAYGPVRGSATNVRMTMRVDYHPEICKDYKETGYCGFGDTCVFIHDRGDYKSGWQIEKEWAAKQAAAQEKMRKRLLGGADSESDGNDSESSAESEDDDGVPFCCLICKEKWTEESAPVVTSCNHYFCEKCAFEHYATSANCAVCNKATHGIFNGAEKVYVRLRHEQQKAEKETQQADG